MSKNYELNISQSKVYSISKQFFMLQRINIKYVNILDNKKDFSEINFNAYE